MFEIITDCLDKRMHDLQFLNRISEFFDDIEDTEGNFLFYLLLRHFSDLLQVLVHCVFPIHQLIEHILNFVHFLGVCRSIEQFLARMIDPHHAH